MSTPTAVGVGPRMISLGFDPEPWPAGTHVCMIFDDDAERRSVIAKYIPSGFDGNEVVSYFTDTLSPEEVAGASKVGLPEELDGRQYRILAADRGYCPDGSFNVDRLLESRAQRYRRVIQAGYLGTRVTAEMSWARSGIPGADRLAEHKARLNIALRTVPGTGICQYDARPFDGATLHDGVRVHPMMIVHGQVLRNPYDVEPEVFLARKAARSR